MYIYILLLLLLLLLLFLLLLLLLLVLILLYYIYTSSTRSGAEVALKICIRPFSSIELACAVRQPSPCALCKSGVLLHMPHLKLHFALLTSHCFLHTPNFTLHTPHFTLHSWRPTLHTVSRPALAREPPDASNPHWFARWAQILPGLI